MEIILLFLALSMLLVWCTTAGNRALMRDRISLKPWRQHQMPVHPYGAAQANKVGFKMPHIAAGRVRQH
jgi:hypothetical protein